MGKFDGKYVLESQENLGPYMAALGLPEDMCKKLLDPKNKVTVTCIENADGSFTMSTDHSIVPEINNTNTFKIGETTKIEKPWPMTITVNKSGENSMSSKMEMGGKTTISESVIHNYGMSIRGTVEGTALSYKEEFKKVDPKMSGFYVFECEKGLKDVMAFIQPNLKIEDLDLTDMAFRLKECSDGLCIDERFGPGGKKVYSIKYDEEYDYCHPEWNVDDKRITTKTGPGCIKTICKSKKDGKTWEYCMSFCDYGVSVAAKAGNVESSETYRRIPDVEGTWRFVSATGIDNYLACMGVTPSQADDLKSTFRTEYYTLERMSLGKVRVLTNSSWWPSEMVYKVGEAYTMDVKGFGKMEGIMTEMGNKIINVCKVAGKTITINETISGDFLVVDYVIDGNNASSMKAIMTRN